MGDDSDPRAIATEFGFRDHHELGEYMESKQLFWNSETNNYDVMFGDATNDSLARISSNGVCRPQKYSIPRFFSVTTFSHSLRFSGV